ncbi:MAG: penicillin-binding protein 2 [Verrucomicrobia bacterium]|nr:penicillin-binding protein 2 [Verrucomicrobiota bacterium]
MILDRTESRSTWRTFFFGLMIVLGLATLSMTLAYRQLFQVEKWTQMIAQSSSRVVKLPAPRGRILDRNRVALVENRPSYNVALYLDEFGAGPKPGKLVKLVRASVRKLEERMKTLNMPPVRVNDHVVRVHYDQRGPLPLTVWNDLSPTAFAAFVERSPWMPGVDSQVEPVRVYPFGTLACHILGYVGKPETSEDEEDENFDSIGRRAFYQASAVGKAGIEKTMDQELQGTPGHRVIKLNAVGFKEAELAHVAPTPGNDVVLSIDWEIQDIVKDAFTGFRGACVVLDPRNGDVLAMVSVPAFDPNLFIPAIKKADWRTLARDEEKPMINRAIQAIYEPGSTFKIVGTLAGLESDQITPSSNLECGGIYYLGDHQFHCWEKGGHGDMDLRSAITMSCNVYFYTLGKKLGGPPLWNMAADFGLGQKTGIPLDHESAGLVGTETWKRATYPRERWNPGDSVNMVIGQGFINVTPLQMAVAIAAVANGGAVYKPRLVLRIETPEKEPVMEFQPEIHNRIHATPEHIQFLREALLNVIENGTGASVRKILNGAGLEKVKVAGKTGSAQFKAHDPNTGEWSKQTRAWMIAFAPYDEPRYAIALIAEGGESGGRTAGPIIGAIFKKLFQMKEHKELPKSMAVAAIPVSTKAGDVEGDASGQLLGPAPSSSEPTADEEDDEPEPPPAALPAEKVNLP